MKLKKMLQWVTGIFFLINADVWAERQFSPHEVIVLPESEFIRAVYDRPVTTIFALMVARGTLGIAKDEMAVKALDEYLSRTALLALAGESFVPSGTIGQIVTDPATLPPISDDLASKIFLGTLVPKLAIEVNPEKQLRKDRGLSSKQEFPGVWSGWSHSRLFSLHVFVFIENTSRNPISQFETRLLIDQEPGGKPFDLECTPMDGFDSSVTPGKALLFNCFTFDDRLEISDLVKAIRATQNSPARMRLSPSRIIFTDPAVGIWSRTGSKVSNVAWMDSAQALQKASNDLKSAGCKARGSCLEDFRMEMKTSPQYTLIFWGILAGVLIGWFNARSAKRPMLSGAAITLLPVCAIVVLIMAILMMTTGMGSLVALAVAYFGFFILAPYIVSFWITTAILSAIRTGKAVG